LFTLQDVDLSLVHVAVRRHVLGASGSGHDQTSYDGRDRGDERTRPRSGSDRRVDTTGRRSQA
jgi:hypothetical protein